MPSEERADSRRGNVVGRAWSAAPQLVEPRNLPPAPGLVFVTTKKGARDGQLHTTYSFDSYYGIQEPVQLIPMMNLQQYVQYMQDAAAAQGQDTALDKIFTAKQLHAIENNISTDWQRAVPSDGLRRSMQGGMTGSSAGQATSALIAAAVSSACATATPSPRPTPAAASAAAPATGRTLKDALAGAGTGPVTPYYSIGRGCPSWPSTR